MREITRESVRREVDELARAVARLTAYLSSAQSPIHRPQLTAVHDVVRRATADIETLPASTASGIPPIFADRLHEYFPRTSDSVREITEEEAYAADTRWARALGRGSRYRESLRALVGPLLTPSEVAVRVGVSRVTVNNWRRQNKLLGIKLDDHQYLYPRFQFASEVLESEHGIIHRLSDVLTAMGDVPTWSRVQFLLDPIPTLGDRAPLEVLRGGRSDEIEHVLQLARTEGRMGA